MNNNGFFSIPILIVFALGVMVIVGIGVYLYPHSSTQSQVQVSSSTPNSIVSIMTSSTPTSTPTVSNASTSLSTTTVVSSTQTSISWSDAQILIKQCQVKSMADNYIDKNDQFIGGDYITLKNGQELKINQTVGFQSLNTAAQNVSSTCGVIQMSAARM